ncbi:uncharacterized protein LOC122933831 isoform X1 [Bufo gargarizans]|uniref:uncharacterized protein LOC122933831 isoform X1 n=1 Tax=Bufo gargarizans TaxID=30331 RepID=UPI001CF45E2B|nr:uncharacterized protein LOC122933831 isoform X1 [Bufo gargarizans]XP_044144827.1 uncharacterized protein LOC122933831 isoform X1 [Bufo gargarizans]XP_044144828.1 uncharacterized protein LOC122933831 isoform X1 [Bufo gargarizans]
MSTRTYPMSVTFHDVAACFSAEEWVGLEDWQKDLYKKVMLEIHSALEAMGFEILNRDVLFCIKKVKDLYMDVCEKDRANSGAASSPRDPSRIMGLKQERGAHLVSCQKKGAKSTSHPACGPDLLLRIQQDDQTQQSPAHISAEPILTSVFSLQNDEEELHPADAAESRPIPAHRRLSSQAIKQEKVDYVKVSVGGHGSNGTTATPTGRPSSQLMKYEDLDYMKVPVGGPGSDGAGATSRGQVTTKPIKQEEPEYIKVSVGAQGLVNTTVSSRDAGEPTLHICDTASPSQFPVTQVSVGSQSTSAPSPGVPRLRIVKFTEKELDVLVDLVIENYSKLFGNEADITPSMAKNAMWQAIANEVSAIGVASRTSDKVKKRWKDAKRKMNEKLSEAAAHVAETGRRPPPHLRLAPYEQRLRDFFKPEYSKEVDWNQDKEDLPEEVEAEPVECVHPEAARSFSPQCQDAAEDSSKDSSEEPSIISPECRPHPSDVMEETAPESEPDPHDHHQFPTISSTLHNLTSHQRQSNLLMQEQNAILSQIAYSLNLLQIQQTDGLAALGNIIQRGIEVIRPASSMSPNDRTTEHSSVHTGLRRQVMNISHGDQPVPQKRKIT